MKKSNRTLIVGTILSIVLGVVAGEIAVQLGAPFYFGFFCGFVLSGLVTLFWLAAVLSGPSG